MHKPVAEIDANELIMVLNSDGSLIWHRMLPFSFIGEMSSADKVVVPAPTGDGCYIVPADGLGILFDALTTIGTSTA